jgi:hypothetical protein
VLVGLVGYKISNLKQSKVLMVEKLLGECLYQGDYEKQEIFKESLQCFEDTNRLH